jgi:GNAT superfamily N-acetyltransferase
VPTIDVAQLRAAYDEQVRRSVEPDGTGAVVMASPRLLRWAEADGRGWSGITWSDLDAGNADEIIAGEIEYFSERSQRFEWKLYDYDRPADLAARLLAAGFEAEEEETLLIAAVATAAGSAPPPPGVRLVPIVDTAGVDLLIDVHERVFGIDHSQLRRSLVAQLETSPEATAMVVAMDGDQAVSSARIEFLPGRDFASLWGGGTLPDWRGRGIYRSIVAHRARLAAERGYRYLQVDASSQSRPILERLGFAAVATTTPYFWRPGSVAAGCE